MLHSHLSWVYCYMRGRKTVTLTNLTAEVFYTKVTYYHAINCLRYCRAPGSRNWMKLVEEGHNKSLPECFKKIQKAKKSDEDNFPLKFFRMLSALGCCSSFHSSDSNIELCFPFWSGNPLPCFYGDRNRASSRWHGKPFKNPWLQMDAMQPLPFCIIPYFNFW